LVHLYPAAGLVYLKHGFSLAPLNRYNIVILRQEGGIDQQSLLFTSKDEAGIELALYFF
jgi:hypothetical protein